MTIALRVTEPTEGITDDARHYTPWALPPRPAIIVGGAEAAPVEDAGVLPEHEHYTSWQAKPKPVATNPPPVPEVDPGIVELPTHYTAWRTK